VCFLFVVFLGSHPSIRLVLHFGLSQSIEGYYQEAGRAGRDGVDSACVTLFADSDRNVLLSFISKFSGVARQNGEKNIDAITRLAFNRECRRKMILATFGESFEGNCGKCDVCLGVESNVQNNLDVAKEASMLLDCIGDWKSLTLKSAIDMLQGKNVKGKESAEKRSYFGAGEARNKAFWTEICRALVFEGHLIEEIKSFAVGGRTVAYREVRVNGISPLPAFFACSFSSQSLVSDVKKTKQSSLAGAVQVSRDSGLLSRVRAARQQTAFQRKEAADLVCSDISLNEMDGLRPRTPAKVQLFVFFLHFFL
jgi:ATP-dependent DNA helicase RecQ